jgi:hypothetical protein
MDLHYTDTTSALVWKSDGNKTVSSWKKSLALSEARRMWDEGGERINVQTRSFRVLYFSRDIIRIIPVRNMIPPGHVGGQAVEMWGFYRRSM